MLHSAERPVVIYHIPGSRGFRIVWGCEELGLPYQLVCKHEDNDESMRDIRRVNPLMPMSPTVKLGDVLLVESGAILEVLHARYGGGALAPALDSADFPAHVMWTHFAESSAMHRFVSTWMVSRALNVKMDQMPEGYRDHRRTGAIASQEMLGPRAVFDFIEEFLSRKPYFGGECFSIADIQMHFAIRMSKLLVWIFSEDYPHVHEWRGRVESRPAYARAMQAALPFGMNEFGLPANAPINPAFDLPPVRRAATAE
ncbi:MAG: glutathione S-transferase family protein [Steroidobacteraceae bacterium]